MTGRSTPESIAAFAKAAGRSERTIRRWLTEERREKPRPRLGRPPKGPEAVFTARAEAALELGRQTVDAGERPIYAALKARGVTLYETRRELKAIKALLRRRDRETAAARRSSLTPLAKDALWGQDATHTGRERAPVGIDGGIKGAAIMTEIVRECATEETLPTLTGPPADADAAVEALKAAIDLRGVAPLVIGHDCGSPYTSETMTDFLKSKLIVSLPNHPRTPQHNAFVERANGELKRAARLSPDDDRETIERKLAAAAERLNHNRRRASRKGLTARVLDTILPAATSMVPREVFYKACGDARTAAEEAAVSWRAKRLAARAAVKGVMERYGLVKLTRGRARAPTPPELPN
jgi:transposase InsO family protein